MKFIFNIVIFLALMLAPGCIADTPQRDCDAIPPGEEMRVAFDIEETAQNTRATERNAFEKKLEDVHILFFDNTADRRYICYAHARVAAGLNWFVFARPEELHADRSYTTLIVGNAHQSVPAGFESFDHYLESIVNRETKNSYKDIQEQLLHVRPIGFYTPDNATALPMAGEVRSADGKPAEFSFVETTTDDGKKQYVVTSKVAFRPAVCRVDLINEAAKLEITRVSIWNGPTAAYWFRDLNAIPPGQTSFTFKPFADADATWDTQLLGGTATDDGGRAPQTLEGRFYLMPKVVARIVQQDDVSAYLMVEGYYLDGTENTADSKTRKSYYRINIGREGLTQHLMRGHRYELKIHDVEEHGAETGLLASGRKKNGLLTSVTKYGRLGDDGVATINDKGEYLKVSTAEIPFGFMNGLKERVGVTASPSYTISYAWERDGSIDAATDPDQWFGYTPTTFGFEMTTKTQNRQLRPARQGRLRVTATKGAETLSCIVTVSQECAVTTENNISVNGREEDQSFEIPAEGGMLDLRIAVEGDPDSKWIAVPVEKIGNDWAVDVFGVKYDKYGQNSSTLTFQAPINGTTGTRTFTLRLLRTQNGVIAGSSEQNARTVTITQPPYTGQLLKVEKIDGKPANEATTYEVEAFVPQPTTPNTAYRFAKSFDFQAQLRDTVNYTYTVESTFNTSDLYISTKQLGLTAIPADIENGAKSITFFKRAFAHVVNTGPGDPDINGELIFGITPKNPNIPNPKTETHRIKVRITTNCIINPVMYEVYESPNYYRYVILDRPNTMSLTNEDGTYDELYYPPGVGIPHPDWYKGVTFDASNNQDTAYPPVVMDPNRVVTPFATEIIPYDLNNWCFKAIARGQSGASFWSEGGYWPTSKKRMYYHPSGGGGVPYYSFYLPISSYETDKLGRTIKGACLWNYTTYYRVYMMAYKDIVPTTGHFTWTDDLRGNVATLAPAVFKIERDKDGGYIQINNAWIKEKGYQHVPEHLRRRRVAPDGARYASWDEWEAATGKTRPAGARRKATTRQK